MSKSNKNLKLNENTIEKNRFLYPLNPYQGQFSPNNLVLNANLQEFAQRVSFIVGLHTNGKLSSSDAYQQIDQLWLELQHHQESAEIDTME